MDRVDATPGFREVGFSGAVSLTPEEVAEFGHETDIWKLIDFVVSEGGMISTDGKVLIQLPSGKQHALPLKGFGLAIREATAR
jgi:hypothetical protein